MTTHYLLTSRQACELLDIPLSTLHWWLRTTQMQALVPSKGRGTSVILSVRQMWALGIAKQVRTDGMAIEIACDIANFLSELPEIDETNSVRFKVRRFVIVVDCAVVTKLISPSEIDKTIKGADGFYGIEVFGLMHDLIAKLEQDHRLAATNQKRKL